MRTVAAVVALVACVHAGLWLLGRDKVDAPNVEGQLSSVSYAPFQGNVNPEDGGKAEAAKIRQDLTVLAPMTKAVRTYSSTAGVELVPGIASEFGVRTTIGAWIDKNKDRNEREMRSVVELSKRHSNVNGIFVGNETIYRGELMPAKGEKLPTKADLAGDERADRIESEKSNEQRRRDIAQPPKGERPIRMTEEEDALLKTAQSPQELDKLRERIGVARLIKMIQKVKRQVSVPVTTGEIYSVWLDHPELVASVDYIAAHILPYWEGFSTKQTVDQALIIYDRLRQTYPGKRVVIAEFGWPSSGYNFHNAYPGRIEQAVILRDFVKRSEAYGVDYNIVEAIDQPWKIFEGGVGPYWGMLDANRQPKFAWSGPVTDPDHWKIAAIALLVSVLLSLPILTIATASFWQATTLAAAANVVGAWSAALFGYWYGHYFVPGAAFALGLGTMLLIPLMIIALARIEEIAAIAFGRKPVRIVPVAPPLAPDVHASGLPAPKVSIHIPAYREHPEMLKQTLDAVAQLDYPNFECIVVVNNTPDPAMWMPIEEHCKFLGERFKFVLANNLQGFKAGALRLATAHTAEDAEVIGIIDADYVVTSDWLRDLMPLFNDPTVGMVQAPQDHRDAGRSPMHTAMNAEYAGFFDIGMVQRNEHNAIVTHGTMVLMRRKAIDASGGWSSDTICEDTDLGLCLLEHGWQAHYTNKRYGYGLLPDTYDAFRKQRDRWAYGGFQIIKKHWRGLITPGATRLNRDQKREFALGWLNWLGAESVGVVVAILNIIWVPVIAFLDIAVPDRILTIPILASFIVSLAHFISLYRLRVRTTRTEMAVAAIAAMSVQWTVARAVAMGLIKDHLPFVRTEKGGGRRKTDFHAFWESIIASLLLLGAFALVQTNYKEVREIYIFAGVLVIQALPFIAAVLIALFERSRFNDFAVLESYRTTIGDLVTRRRARIAKAVAPAQAPQKQPELVQ